MRVRAILLAAALALAPIAARGADLVVWWEAGKDPAEDRAVREIADAFEQRTGKHVDLSFYAEEDMPAKTLAGLAAGRPPDFAFGQLLEDYYGQWAYEGRLVDLTDVLAPLAGQFDRETLDHVALLDGTTGRRGLYALPLARLTNHVHVWNSLLEQAGFTLQDVPKDWEGFWAFWCDRVQPAVRRATGRDDLYGVALAMSAEEAGDTELQFRQFVDAYEADYVTRDGKLVIDEPAIRAGLVRALASYTDIFRKGCTPPASVGWDSGGNNQAFLTQASVMTPNASLSIPNALKAARPEDYRRNAATIGWPEEDAYGKPLAICSIFAEAAVFGAGGHAATAKEFVRFLVGEGWLAHWLDFVGDRFLPPLPALLEQPFWLDATDPHRMAAVMQFVDRPRDYWEAYAGLSGEWRHRRVVAEAVWPKAIHRVAAEGITPERAVDEAIARVHQLLSE
jgi:multiple sugar transport system substrate-binding protein